MEKGFTLIETLIAMALLAFIVADVGMVAVYASRSGTQARRLTGAVSLAENAIEHARSADFNRIRMADTALALCFTAGRNPIDCGNLDEQAVVRECFSASLLQVACGGAGPAYTRDREVETLPAANPPLNLADTRCLSARIDVTVTWTDARGGPQEYRLASLISKF